jgi:sterol desaturase/sphingolipid hydroxylase (fatty acid hydroxylase superfamily)
MVSWLVYPLSWTTVLFLQYLVASGDLNSEPALGLCIGILVGIYLLLEWTLPYERRWGMTFKTWLTDVQYLAMNGLFLGAVSAGLGLLTISTASDRLGPASGWPVWIQLLAIFLIFEACQYSIHRFMHEGRGRLGDFMWRVHAAHHFPDRLYVFMHVVGHPLNVLLIRSLTQVIPIWLMGYHQNVVSFFVMANAMHGLISHFNVDVRMGWLNYIFVGPELHRYHHGTELRDAKNFGATLSLYDLFLGTFIYRPGTSPKSLGVPADTKYPDHRNLLKILAMPFKRQA